ncbi:SPOR domain-containing protein [Desulfonatronospira sp.]|uniref:SPOR domain-containing protein n=1 Tax=Desulfonatronospira sp. TaxID=1962951 RepID=UPI0025C4BBD3|nr:SPOR domain-containing protein [Desulfonatronospira sp.]
MAARNTKNKKKQESRFSLELTPGKTLTLGGFALLAIVWAFILGVFVGRGYNPEEILPDISRILPQKEEKQEDSVILRPEELEFFDRLRSEPSRTPSAAPEPEPQEPDQPLETAALPPDPVPQAESFIYTFQVGSFQSMERAGGLQQRLYQEGFSASINRAFAGSEPWYRVLIEVETTPSQIDSFKQRLGEHGIDQPLLRHKRPS